ncbi:unnamed protein product, partial [Laminaria digitata]
ERKAVAEAVAEVDGKGERDGEVEVEGEVRNEDGFPYDYTSLAEASVEITLDRSGEVRKRRAEIRRRRAARKEQQGALFFSTGRGVATLLRPLRRFWGKGRRSDAHKSSMRASPEREEIMRRVCALSRPPPPCHDAATCD